MTSRPPSLDPILHQPLRTQITAYLSGRGEATFSELKRTLGITDGNLGAHLQKLLDAGFVVSRDSGESQRAQTAYLLTDKGRVALARYIGHLSQWVRFSSGESSEIPSFLEPEPGDPS